jgi:hypothetical protein
VSDVLRTLKKLAEELDSEVLRKAAEEIERARKAVRDPRGHIVAHPMQPVYLDKHKVSRFKANAIVQFLLDKGPHDMNTLARETFSDEDREQFAQLIGYSVSGFGELSYVSDATFARAAKAEQKLLSE